MTEHGTGRRGQHRRAAPTMKHVAALAGVSVMTVSRALATPDRVSPEALEKVRRAVLQTGYVPDRNAGALSSQRSHIVALTLPTLANGNFADLAEGISDILLPAGYQPLIGHSGHSLEKEEELVRIMLARRPDAFVLVGTTHSRETSRLLHASGITVIETWEYTDNPVDLCVGFSNRRAGELAAEHLAGLGHRQLAAIGGSLDDTLKDYRGEQRLRGFRDAARRLGLPDPVILREAVVPIRHGQGAGTMARLLDDHPGASAVFAISDTMAFGAMMECQRRGIAVPRQLSILGFGDFDIAGQCLPGLSTISVDPVAMGRMIGDRILERMAGSAPRSEETAPRIVLRHSTSAPPGA
ncbi:LacI family DNA-binding transcriptional regulator [Mangrovicoccus algicola]|uniref:LacI family DNA-binding transcriptional regulator n=1 Tax=Mangrovicoccus algicola TaxID=2771008 RepID=A0A8J6Z6E2_9RHOB|nr:LacI family DNA-binding transcriptional regulator [Mangrovicoccus algicola]MBE3637265.1 LacI family DNA-binding transcriptional regulator [Mangrovicoccus algicola]